MTDTTRKTDPFEDILLAQAKLMHAEMEMSFTSMRTYEERHKEKKMHWLDMLDNWQREFGRARSIVDDTVKLARTAALLRGQRIFVTRCAAEGEDGENRNSIPQEKFAPLLQAAE